MQLSTHDPTFPVHLHIIFDRPLVGLLDAYRRGAYGLPSRSEVIRAAVREFVSRPAKSRGDGRKQKGK